MIENDFVGRCCGNCVFWYEDPEKEEDADENGECRVNPPNMVDPESYFPETWYDEWCGSHQYGSESKKTFAFRRAKHPLPVILSIPINKLALSCRIHMVLRRENIQTIGDLIKKKSELMHYRGFGRKSLTELDIALKEYGINLCEIKP